uniref:Uncharacterized protein n=1 Tax=Chenopodium quinoa TaxID=63459 RepID=A0A803MVA4_CHEQI
MSLGNFKIQQDYRVLQFLMKLKDEYKQVRSNILMMQPLPTLPMAYKMLSIEEDFMIIEVITLGIEMVISTTIIEEVIKEILRAGTCQLISEETANLVCEFCKMTGHLVDRCYFMVFPCYCNFDEGPVHSVYMNFLESPKDATIAAVAQEHKSKENNSRAAYFA